MRKLTLLTFIASLFLVSCDECKDVSCLNGASCNDGTCECTEGFSGELCEIEDKCITKEVTCENDLPCEDGECACGDWYSGEDCGIKNVDKYVGPYQGYYSSNQYYTFGSVTVTSGEGENVIELMEYTGRAYSAEFATATTFNIPTQKLPEEFGYGTLEVSGSGKLSESGKLEYSIKYNYPEQGSSTTTIYSSN